MQVGTTTVDSNPNANYLESRYFWIAYTASVCFLHFLCSSAPFYDVATAWVLTVNIHNLGNFLVLHYLRGLPFGSSFDQGECRGLTHWEQINHGKQWTNTRKFLIIFPVVLKVDAFSFARKFLIIFPVVLFCMSQHYAGYQFEHFLWTAPSFLLQFIAKQPAMHMKRLFGLNKY